MNSCSDIAPLPHMSPYEPFTQLQSHPQAALTILSALILMHLYKPFALPILPKHSLYDTIGSIHLVIFSELQA